MTRLVLTIDTGTTNTRVRAWDSMRVVAQGDAPVGVRDTARTGSHNAIRIGIHDAIAAALSGAGASGTDVRLVLASGMITSGLGLLEVPHVAAPAGRPELAAGMRDGTFADVFGSPIWFVPGVRNDALPVTMESAGAMDMMRGEETETIGLLARLDNGASATTALTVLHPGSHAKFIGVDPARRITGCVSTLSGELLDLLVHQSVLASGMPREWPESIDEAALVAGARLSRSAGAGRAVFATRVLEVYGNTTPALRYAFLLGGVLMQDLLTMHATSGGSGTLVICGRPSIQHAYAVLARLLDAHAVPILPAADTLADLAGYGALLIARERGLL